MREFANVRAILRDLGTDHDTAAQSHAIHAASFLPGSRVTKALVRSIR